MAILIGTDEAGYGPNLGPLVVATTAWRVPDALIDADLYELLGDAVCRDVTPGRLCIADSKKVYKPGGGLAGLELAVWSAIRSLSLWERIGEGNQCWRSTFESLSPTTAEQFAEIAWYADFNCPTPIDVDEADLKARALQLRSTCEAAGVQLLSLQAEVVFPRSFNQQVARLGSKGALLTQTTLDLARRQLPADLGEPVLICCDKHGGRNRYGPAIGAAFDVTMVKIVKESRPESAYRLKHRGQPIELKFRVGGESFLPTALASMTAKYLRELAMRAFNAFWQAEVPGVKPTAGYPTDAKRFRQEIDDAVKRLAIDEDFLWRSR